MSSANLDVQSPVMCAHANECPTGLCTCNTWCYCKRTGLHPDGVGMCYSPPKPITAKVGKYIVPIGQASNAITQRLKAAREAEREGNISKAVEALMSILSDGQAMALQNTYGAILRILVQHVGERGDSEGAVECLQRIIKERNHFAARFVMHTQLTE